MYSINIFDFEDYRKFLIIISEVIKKELSFTYRELNEFFGFKSTNFIQLVCKRERNLTYESAELICKALELKKDEIKYFYTLVDLNQCTDVSKHQTLINKLNFLRDKNRSGSLLKSQYNYYSDWYNIVIRECIQVGIIDSELDTLESKLIPPISKSQKQQALKALVELKMIHKTKNKNFSVINSTVRTGDQFNHNRIIQFHYKMLELAKESINQFDSSEREIGALTVGLSQKSFEKVKQRLKDLKEEILELSASDSESDRIYQMNLQLFPLSKKLRGLK